MENYPDIPSEAFLKELLERARRYGWSGDYFEVEQFVRELHSQAGIKLTEKDVVPYQDD